MTVEIRTCNWNSWHGQSRKNLYLKIGFQRTVHQKQGQRGRVAAVYFHSVIKEKLITLARTKIGIRGGVHLTQYILVIGLPVVRRMSLYPREDTL